MRLWKGHAGMANHPSDNSPQWPPRPQGGSASEPSHTSERAGAGHGNKGLEDDPLVQLARIVSGRSKSAHEDAEGQDVPLNFDDLESELQKELQQRFVVQKDDAPPVRDKSADVPPQSEADKAYNQSAGRSAASPFARSSDTNLENGPQNKSAPEQIRPFNTPQEPSFSQSGFSKPGSDVENNRTETSAGPAFAAGSLAASGSSGLSSQQASKPYLQDKASQGEGSSFNETSSSDLDDLYADERFDDPEPQAAMASYGYDDEEDYHLSSSPFARYDDENQHSDHLRAEESDSSFAQTQSEDGTGASPDTASSGQNKSSVFASDPGVRSSRKGQSRNGLLIGASVAALLVALPLFYMFTGSDTHDTAEAPRVIAADDAPVKVRPENTETAANQPGDAVFDKMEGVQGNNNPESALPSTASPRVILPAPNETSPAATNRSAPSSPSQADNTSAPAQSDESNVLERSETAEQQARVVLPSESADTAPQPRRIRTVTVRPDGTVISSQEENGSTSSSNTELSSVQPQNQGLNEAQAILGQGLNRPPSSPNESQQAGNTAPESLPSNQASDEVSLTETLPNYNGPIPPLPVARPDAGIASDGPATAPAQTQTASVQPAAPSDNLPLQPYDTNISQSATSQPVARGNYVVQLASLRSEDVAVSTFRGLQQRFALLQQASPDIQRADLGDRGIYYRLRVGPYQTREEAVDLCERLKAAGGDCLVQRR
jgi:hypothetical protein